MHILWYYAKWTYLLIDAIFSWSSSSSNTFLSLGLPILTVLNTLEHINVLKKFHIAPYGVCNCSFVSSRKQAYIGLTTVNPHFYIVKLRLTGVYINFLITSQKRRLCPTIYILSRNMKLTRIFHLRKVRVKSRERHNYKPQPLPDTKWTRKPTNPNKHKSNKRTKSTRISSFFPKRGNRNAKRTEKHKNKMTQCKTYRLIE